MQTASVDTQQQLEIDNLRETVARLTEENARLAAERDAALEPCEACAVYNSWPTTRDELIAHAVVLERKLWLISASLFDSDNSLFASLDELRRDLSSKQRDVDNMLDHLHETLQFTQ